MSVYVQSAGMNNFIFPWLNCENQRLLQPEQNSSTYPSDGREPSKPLASVVLGTSSPPEKLEISCVFSVNYGISRNVLVPRKITLLHSSEVLYLRACTSLNGNLALFWSHIFWLKPGSTLDDLMRPLCLTRACFYVPFKKMVFVELVFLVGVGLISPPCEGKCIGYLCAGMNSVRESLEYFKSSRDPCKYNEGSQ